MKINISKSFSSTAQVAMSSFFVVSSSKHPSEILFYTALKCFLNLKIFQTNDATFYCLQQTNQMAIVKWIC